jgi:hypothetical protein
LLCGAGIDCRTRASIESGDVVSRVKRQARDLAGAMRFSLALRTSCIRSFLMHQNLKRSGATFLRAMTIHRLDRLTASAGSAEKSMLVCVCVCVCGRPGGSHDLCVHQIWKAIITSLLLRVIYI